MGHLVGKALFRELGRKIDGLETRAPWNDRLYALLKELYTEEEAELIIRMPYGLTNFNQLEKITGYEEGTLRRLLDGLTAKGLVADIWINEAYHYIPPPIIVGIFEFTMMRMGPDLNTKEWARLLHNYMDDSYFAFNWGEGMKYSVNRALPHEEAIKEEEFTEVLDYEKASAIIDENDRFSVGLCSCRHKKMHLGEELCAVPMETCTQFGYAADMMVRHGMGREVTKSEMKELFARSREMGLVLTADNVQKNLRFVCHCCSCCCIQLEEIRRNITPNFVVTSNYLAGIDDKICVGCGKCAKACPINAITMHQAENRESKRKQAPRINTDICLGCGVCALVCPKKACRLTRRGQRVIHPETTFERLMLECLERGTLQNRIFDDPNRVDQKFMRVFVGAFLRLPPVKQALLSDKLRSGFLNAMKDGVRKQGKGWLLDM